MSSCARAGYPAEPLYGTSLAALLSAALDSGGGISHLETGRLAHLGAAQRGAGG